MRGQEVALPKYLHPTTQWWKTVGLYRDYQREMLNPDRLLLGGNYGPRIGVVVLNHRLFVPGDVVIVEMTNGSNNRQQVFAMTSKRRRVIAYYMRYAAPYAFATYDAGPLRIPELPGDLAGKRLDDPGAWLFAKSLRADVTAWRLGTGRPPLNERRH